MIKRNLRTLALTGALVVMMACGIQSALNAAFAGLTPAVDYLEATHKIDAETARELRVDVPDVKNVAVGLASQLKQIPKDAPDARVQKLQAWQSAEEKWVAIVDRGHFKLSPELQGIVDLANSIFEAAIAGYGGPSGGTAVVKAGRAQGASVMADSPQSVSDKDLERGLQLKLKQLARKINKIGQ